ncbi:GrpE protein like protein, mitochondrial [Cladophialophora carrionii]|uniref:GrpE protein homolog, mitochondrial n=1 Tax=Cladophialophora carrionii TaxID=86049 RepID=A0A1C1D0B6_9EURO|nr:GrpE protein like protein, mitochondrial [Cladophialophora carrionii]
MFRRQVLRQSRSLSKSLSELAQAHHQRSPFSSATFLSPRASTYASTSLPSRLQQRRWQSSEPDKSKASADSAPPSTEESKPTDPKPEDALKEELEKTKREVIDLKDKYLRSVADYRNLQDRTRRDMESARQFAIQRFATDLLDSIDNLDRALSSVPPSALGKGQSSADSTAAAPSAGTAEAEPNKDLQNLFAGLKMTEEILLNTLQKHGLERFDPMENGGRKFDPNTDEATFFTKVEGKEDGDVFFTQSKGYKLNGRVVRAAKVGIVKNS